MLEASWGFSWWNGKDSEIPSKVCWRLLGVLVGGMVRIRRFFKGYVGGFFGF